MRFSWVQKLSIGTGAALGLLALVGFLAYVSISQMMGGQRAVAETNQNIGRLDVVVGRTVDAENAQRGFVTTGQEEYLEPLNAAVSDVEDAIQGLTKETEDNPEQRRNLDKLAPMVSARFKDINGVIATRKRVGRDSAAALMKVHAAVRGRGGIGQTAAVMREQELRVLGERTRSMTASGDTALRVILFGSVLSVLFALFALQPLRPSVGRRITERLSVNGAAAPPELQLTINESSRHAGDRLLRLQQVIAALNGPVTDAEIAQALLTRGAPPLVASVGLVAVGTSSFTVLRALGEVVAGLTAGSSVPPNLSAPLTESLRSRESLIVESRAERLTRYPALGRFSDAGTADAAFVVVPLVDDEKSYGVILLAFADNRVFSEDERAYLATLGRLGGQAIARTGAADR